MESWLLGQTPPPEATSLIEYSGWGALVLAVLAWLGRELFPYLKDKHKAEMAERHADEERLIQPYKEQIASLKADVKRLDGLLTSTSDRHEKEVAALRNEHLDCVKNHAALEATVNHLMDEVRGLRAWRHEVANKDQVALANAEADKLAASLPKGGT
jgi:hypothetical protein